MFRFIGRLYFWLVLVPTFWKFLRPALTSVGQEQIHKMRMSMTPEQRNRYDRIMRTPRRETHPTPTPTANDNQGYLPKTPRFPVGFQAS